MFLMLGAYNLSEDALLSLGNPLLDKIFDDFYQLCEYISDYAQGKIDGEELAYNLGENAAAVTGSMVGGAVGGTIGSVAGPAGSAAGAIVGGTVGCTLATEAYQTAVKLGAEGAELIAGKAQELAFGVVDKVSEVAPEALDDVKNAFSDFSAKAKISLPF